MKTSVKRITVFLLCWSMVLFSGVIVGAGVSIEDEEGHRDYFEDNYEPDPFEDLAPEFDQVNTYFPREMNESRFMGDGIVYIHNVVQDPPNTFRIMIYDARNQLYFHSEVELIIQTGIWNDVRQLIPENQQRIMVKLKPGWNIKDINMHHYKAQIIGVGLGLLRTKSKILPLELKDAL